jgi:hypothetical protein
VPFGASLLILMLLTFAGGVGTLATLLFRGLRPLRPYAWRMWLWGTVGLVVANMALFAILVPILSRVGAAHGSAPLGDTRTVVTTNLVIVGPLLASLVGVLAGTGLGIRLAGRPSNNRGRGP